MKKEIYLVTGAAGFLGSNVCRLLSASGKRVRGLAHIGVRILALAGKTTGKDPLLSEFNIYMLNRNNEFDCSKAERELGFHCRLFSESIKDTVIWLRKEGFLDAVEDPRVVDIGLADLLLLPVKKSAAVAKVQTHLKREVFCALFAQNPS